MKLHEFRDRPTTIIQNIYVRVWRSERKVSYRRREEAAYSVAELSKKLRLNKLLRTPVTFDSRKLLWVHRQQLKLKSATVVYHRIARLLLKVLSDSHDPVRLKRDSIHVASNPQVAGWFCSTLAADIRASWVDSITLLAQQYNNTSNPHPCLRDIHSSLLGKRQAMERSTLVQNDPTSNECGLRPHLIDSLVRVVANDSVVRLVTQRSQSHQQGANSRDDSRDPLATETKNGTAKETSYDGWDTSRGLAGATQTEVHDVIKRIFDYPLAMTLFNGDSLPNYLPLNSFLEVGDMVLRFKSCMPSSFIVTDGMKRSILPYSTFYQQFTKWTDDTLGAPTGRKDRDLLAPLRLVLTGSLFGPPLAATVYALGIAEAILPDIALPFQLRWEVLRFCCEVLYFRGAGRRPT